VTVLSILATGLASATGCRHSAMPAPTEAQVLLRAHSGRETRVKVEVARTEDERTRGLMFRQKLDPGCGMLFLFPQPERLKFWMHNTYIPLDMIFFGADRRVVAVVENAEPLTDSPRGPDAETQYVLEVPGGWAQTVGIEPGMEARFIGVGQ
jgi:uncharacterized membrane protein (UPF0127 family)